MSALLDRAAACPCGGGQPYGECCGPWHVAGERYLKAPDPERLMRSRYSAFVLDLRNYLLATWHPSTRPAAIDAPSTGLKWLGLEIRAVRDLSPTQGVVEFVARSKLAGRASRLHETSRFVLEEGRWLYVDGAIGD